MSLCAVRPFIAALAVVTASAVAPAIATAAPTAAIGVEDGVVPAGVSVFDDSYPAVSRLDGTLLTALRSAAVVAHRRRDVRGEQRLAFARISAIPARPGRHHLRVTPETRRWVATPATSPHVSGKAIDLGGTGAADWLDRFGATYGLCQIYQNEPWHFEFRAQATMRGCPPATGPDPDPRMR